MVPPRPRRRERPTFPCPNCGADVREGALACPECGSDEHTGWSEDTYVDGIDLPEEADVPTVPDTFEEFERRTRPRRDLRRVIGFLILAALALALFRGVL